MARIRTRNAHRRASLSHLLALCLLSAQLAPAAMAQELGIPQASDSTSQAAKAAGDATQGQPVYLMSSFTAAAANKLSVFASNDGVTFTTLASEAFTAPEALLRDPSIVRHTDGYYYVAYTSSQAGAAFGITRSRDLKSWQPLGEVKIALPGITAARAPEWLRDGDGSLKIVLSLSSTAPATISATATASASSSAAATGTAAATGAGTGFAAYVLEPNADFSQWSAPRPLPGLEGYLDTVILPANDGYTAFVRNEKTGHIELASAQTLSGPWTIKKKGDWAGWGAHRSGPSLVRLPNGGWRIYFEEDGGKRAWYADSQDGFNTWSEKKEVGGVSSVARHFTVLAEDPKRYADATRPKGQPKKISWDEHSLMVDGKRIVVWSGEIHPFRLPNPSLWRDVLQKMKAIGFNGVAFYFDWGYHSAAPGVYDFAGVRNVERALQIAEEEGMYVIARTGPYVNAELTGGGYPGWMFRNRAEARTDDPAYTAATDEWMTQINAIIARHQASTGGGNVIAYQLENELGKVEPKHVRHMQHLARKARADGISVPFFHNAAGRLPDWTPKDSTAPWANAGPTDMYAFDGYPGGSCNVFADPSGPNKAPDWGIYGKPGLKAGALSSPRTPGFAAELGGGWFDYWGSNGTYGCTAQRQGKGYQRVFYGTNLINRITIHNVYMTFGGTSWGWLAGPVVYTSYDYGAAIAEDRGLREKAYALKQQGMFVQAAQQALAEMDKGPELNVSNPRLKVYHNINPKSGTHILFAVHNPSDALSDDRGSFGLSTRDGDYQVPLRVNGQDGKLLLASYAMERQHLVYSTSEIQTHFRNGERDIVLLHGRDKEEGETVLRYASAPKVEVLSGQVVSAFDAVKGDLKLSYAHDGLARVRITGGGRAPLLLLLADEKASFNMWRQETDQGPVLQSSPALIRSARFNGATLALAGDTSQDSPLQVWGPPASAITFNGVALAFSAQPDGSLLAASLKGPEKFVLPNLAKLAWTRRMDSPEAQAAFDDSQWLKADNRPSAAQTWTMPERGQPTLSMSDYGFHHGDVWYRGRVTITDPRTNQLELFYGGGGAGMIQVWIDGRFVGQDEMDTGRSFPETTDSVKYSLGNLARGEHVIAVMVRNNSHNWNLMADDYHREARGLISASLTARGGQRFAVPIAWRIQGNQGGEAIADTVRGPLNNGGLYGERAGWHLPANQVGKQTGKQIGKQIGKEVGKQAGRPDSKRSGQQDGWQPAPPTAAPPAPGTYWLRTSFALDLPQGHDIQLGLTFGDASQPRSERSNRALIFVNGWNMGQFIAHIGPQRTFVIPPGILNPNGQNTIALAVTTDGKPENALEPVTLTSLRAVRGGVPLEIMPASVP